MGTSAAQSVRNSELETGNQTDLLTREKLELPIGNGHRGLNLCGRHGGLSGDPGGGRHGKRSWLPTRSGAGGGTGCKPPRACMPLCSLHEALCMEGGIREEEQSGGGVQGGTSTWGPSWGEQQSEVELGEGQQPLPVLSLTRAPELGGLRRVRLLSLTGLPSSQTCFRPPAPQRKVQRLADDI